jgi:hypothetical protein
MPQFEIKDSSSTEEIKRIRARTAEEAVRAWYQLSPDTMVSLEREEDQMDELEGWRIIRVHGHMKGRIRAHQRMRFRRD